MKKLIDPLRLVETSYGVNVLFGRRGVGKTTFLIQSALEASKRKHVLLLLSDKARDRRILCRLLKFANFNNPSLLEIKTISMFTDAILILASYSETDIKDHIIIIDDVLPFQFYIGRYWDRKTVYQTGVFISLLNEIIGKSQTLWISLPEYTTIPLPRRWGMFIELSSTFYRLYRKRRIRELYIVSLKNIPQHGERWVNVLKRINISQNIIAKLLLTSKGFLTLSNS